MTDAISRLADALRHVRDGEGTTAEVVRWLRACAEMAADAPAPTPANARRGYTRTLLYKNEMFEVLALRWKPNCRTAIHDHGGALCWLSVARGAMHVENYVRTDDGKVDGYAAIRMEGREELSLGAVDYRQDDVHLHRCIVPDCETVSLHVYANPIERFHAFDERSNTCSEIISTYDAVLR